MSEEAPVFYPSGTIVSYKDRVGVVIENNHLYNIAHVRIRICLWDGGRLADIWELRTVNSSDLFPYTDPPSDVVEKIPQILDIPFGVGLGKL